MEPSDLAAASVSAAEIAAVHHQAAAQGCRDQQIKKAAMALPGTELHFTDRGRRGVVFHKYGNAEYVAQQVVHLDGGPSRIVAWLIG